MDLSGFPIVNTTIAYKLVRIHNHTSHRASMKGANCFNVPDHDQHRGDWPPLMPDCPVLATYDAKVGAGIQAGCGGRYWF